MLGVTHAALYKHFKNKEDLLQKLALKWLENTSRSLFEWNPEEGVDDETALHDWLWLLHLTKKDLYQHDQKMFLLYTNYIETDSNLVRGHLSHLAKKVEEISGWENREWRLLQLLHIFTTHILLKDGAVVTLNHYLNKFGLLFVKLHSKLDRL